MTAFNAQTAESHYAAIRARLRPTPQVNVVRRLPSAPRVYTEAEETALNAQIERNQQLLAGCGISGRLKMLMLPILQSHDVTWMQMLRGGRAVCYRDCKREVWAMLYDEGLSYPQIGKLFGNDHTSILHGVKAWREAHPCPTL